MHSVWGLRHDLHRDDDVQPNGRTRPRFARARPDLACARYQRRSERDDVASVVLGGGCAGIPAVRVGLRRRRSAGTALIGSKLPPMSFADLSADTAVRADESVAGRY